MKSSSVYADDLKRYSEAGLSNAAVQNIERQFEGYTKKHSKQEFDETILKKFFILSDALHKKYEKGCRIINALKISAAGLFLVFTVIAAAAGKSTGSKMLWLSIWILVIFILIGAFIIADYLKNLMSQKVLPFLDNTEIMDFGKENDEDDSEEGNENNEKDF